MLLHICFPAFVIATNELALLWLKEGKLHPFIKTLDNVTELIYERSVQYYRLNTQNTTVLQTMQSL